VRKGEFGFVGSGAGRKSDPNAGPCCDEMGVDAPKYRVFMLLRPDREWVPVSR